MTPTFVPVPDDSDYVDGVRGPSLLEVGLITRANSPP